MTVSTPSTPVQQAAAPAAAPAPQAPAQSGIPYVPPAPVAPAAPVEAPQATLDPNQFANPSQAGTPAAPIQQPAPQSQPQAPAEPPAQQTPAQAELTLTEKPLYKHEPTGNAAYDMAMNAFATKGFSPDHPAFVPASKGDFSALEAFVKEQGIDPQYLALAQQAYTQISEHHNATHGETIKKALEVAGGQERWNKVQAWVQDVASPEEITYYKQQLEAGGVATLKAVEYLSGLYGQHAENAPAQPSESPATPFNTNSSPTIATNGAPISPQEFRAELSRLIDKVGYSGLETSPEYKALQQRRQAWRG